MDKPSKDWIQLSAYIDGELSRREGDLLERRLKSDPQLQSALDQLRTTKGVLQSAPSLPVPRNFILSSKMVGKKLRKPAAAGYRLAAAMMSFLLIGVLILDFGRFFLGGAMAPAAPMMEEAFLESAAKEVSDTVISDVEGEVHQDRMAAEPGEDAPVEEAAPTVEAELLLEAYEAVEGAQGPEPVAGAVAEKEVVEETLGTEMDTAGEEKSGSADAVETETNLVTEEEQPQAADQSLPSQTPQPQPTMEYFYPEEDIYSPPWYSRIPVFRILELLLGLGVIGFGTAAWIIRRKHDPSD